MTLTILITLFSILVIVCRNPIHSIFCLIMVFINSAITLFFLELEFLALILLIVYAGAVSVLFLFVVLLLNIKNSDIDRGFLIFESPVFCLLFAKSIIFLSSSTFSYYVELVQYKLLMDNDPVALLIASSYGSQQDVFVLSNFLYTHYALYLILAGLILLVAMVGAITLTRK